MERFRTNVIAREGELLAPVPDEIAERLGLREGDTVMVELTKIERDFFGVLAGIGHFSEPDHADHR